MEEYDEFGNLIIKEEEEDQNDFLIPENVNDLVVPPPVIIDENPPLPEIVPEKATYLEEWFTSAGDVVGLPLEEIPGIDFVSDLWRASKQGWASSDAVDETFEVFKGDTDDESLDAMRLATEEAQRYGQSEEAQEWQMLTNQYKQEGDSGAWAGFKALMQNPTFGAETVISSMVGAIGTIFDSEEAAAMAGAGAAIGAKGGAALGAAAGSIGGPLALLTGTAGAGGGAVSGAFAGAMTAMETSATFAELLREKVIENGGDPNSNDDIRAVLENPEEMSNLRWRAGGRGLTIGAIEGITGVVSGGVGGRILGGATKAAGKGFKLAAKGLAATTAIEAAGGALGETAGMLVAGQELAGEEILLEGVAGVAMAPVQLKSSLADAKKAIKDATPSYTFNGAETTRDQMAEMIKAPDVDFMKMKFKATNDPEINAQITARRESILANAKQYSQVNAKQPDALPTINKDIAEDNVKEIQPSAISEEFKQNQKEKNRLKAQLKETEVIAFTKDEIILLIFLPISIPFIFLLCDTNVTAVSAN